MASINLFLQHYHSGTPVGKKLQFSLEELMLEVSTNRCPLVEPFAPLGPGCVHSWVKCLWERIDFYKLEVLIDFPTIPLPRHGDQLLRDLFVSLGFTGADLHSLHRVRIHVCALFLSDLVTANGRQIEEMFLSPQPQNTYSSQSSYRWREERPSTNDWTIWVNMLQRLTWAGHYLRQPLGKWVAPSHRIWQSGSIFRKQIHWSTG